MVEFDHYSGTKLECEVSSVSVYNDTAGSLCAELPHLNGFV